ncbi:heteromeric transposase endonuclease subunit TnsA [Clostridium formicaceticum]|uniref:Transposon Tn7 transposition protein TnsA n=1 Tax=Clostridium formicaceticum TaxID=1497 RepID=A0AAC9RPQ2_9CLOT|nr:heteromeric transposase endonuclease subunit TnsA [Clostridium formicaceticum]AOY75002.1 hypothetical protein BJL90_02915 [Clostridium formicaceticum]ARE89417.1 Transposon Tn7 transposition protein TnsA [Clostridium formicaceticum]
MARQKSDKYKLIEGRGVGAYNQYKPWLKVHEFGAHSRVHRIKGWKTGRIHQLMSDLELYYFLIIQWEDKVIDIREQFPLLPIEQTILLANEMGIRHPAEKNKIGKEYVMTTDFLITIQDNNNFKNIVRTVKAKKDFDKQRTREKLLIEKQYFQHKKIDWGIVLDIHIDKIKAQNLYSIYNYYDWNQRNLISDYQLLKYINDFKMILNDNNNIVIESTLQFERMNSLKDGEGLSFLKYLILHKKVQVDMNKLFNYSNMKVFDNDIIETKTNV